MPAGRPATGARASNETQPPTQSSGGGKPMTNDQEQLKLARKMLTLNRQIRAAARMECHLPGPHGPATAALLAEWQRIEARLRVLQWQQRVQPPTPLPPP